MLCVKHSVVFAAGAVGGIFGYVSGETQTWTLIAALVGMFACAWVADVLTQPLEEDEDEQS